MRQIKKQHLKEPGLAMVEIAAADTATALAVQATLAGRWATSVTNPYREPGEPGVRLTCYLDIRQDNDT
ncbi:hypothetical protein EJC51_47240 [Streptomyces aquilus]|uniref:Uncharacterized protein n=1 Tax=Streptomyces aquilus TaxID=2548456 RepID=A0A3S9HRT9_9ACTN|nr:DUF6207 family protein [Streptomyces aquilus]AZP14747.1 hypothetical protein EJC51_00305 [Streptomyces aquilus]AZP22957.1 hypothetical protein EJC51_47240 [Streptomyces aquilus]